VRTPRGHSGRGLRVAFLVIGFPKLSQPFILNQAAGLLDRGHDLSIFALGGFPLEDTTSVHPIVDSYGLLERTRYAPAPKGYLARATCGLRLLAASDRRNLGRRLSTVNGFVYGREGISFKLLFAASALMDAGPFDIVHSQFGTLGRVAVALRKAGVIGSATKVVTTFRGFDISQYVRRRGPDCYRDLFRRGDFFLVNCDYFRERAIALGCDPARIVTHRSGIDCDKFAFEPRRPPGDGHLRIASVGRLTEKKGYEYALRAVASLASATDGSLTYTVIGDGPLRPRLVALADELGIGHLTEFIGAQPQPMILDTLYAAHLFVAPSVTASDGSQDAPINVLKEAMATGLPVVSTRHGGIPELVEDGVSGFLVPERDADAIAAKLLYLAEHPEAWPALGKAGRRRVEADYDMSRLNDELEHIYEDLCTEKFR
jgi:colanic acid/amylovoran biosynthesis glycosyltransferase